MEHVLCRERWWRGGDGDGGYGRVRRALFFHPLPQHPAEVGAVREVVGVSDGVVGRVQMSREARGRDPGAEQEGRGRRVGVRPGIRGTEQ